MLQIEVVLCLLDQLVELLLYILQARVELILDGVEVTKALEVYFLGNLADELLLCCREGSLGACFLACRLSWFAAKDIKDVHG